MTTADSRTSNQADDTFFSQVRVPVRAVIIALAATGGVIGIAGGNPRAIGATLPVALLIFMLAGAAWLVVNWREDAGAWAALGGTVTAVLLVRFWLPVEGALVLLALPAIVGLLLLGYRQGMWIALGCSLLVGWLWLGESVGSNEAALTGALLWLLVELHWYTLRAIAQVVGWSESHYRSAQTALEEVRASRAQLHQTLDDLAHANRQLGLMNRRLVAAQMAAEEAHKTKAAFVANVSHEFRTPLNMIIGLSDLLIEAPHVYGSRLPGELLEDLEIVRRNTQHLLAMVNDVLDLSQIEANRLALHRERTGLAGVVEQAAAVVRPLLAMKSVPLHLDIPPDLTDIYCDANRVRQVLVNLLSNAARHTETGAVRVEVSQSDRWVTLCVRDTGPGIPPQDAAHIFEPFYRGTYGTRRNENGSGLGLSISKQFIEMHDGQMWLESQLGQGSAFYFTLPLHTLSLPDEGAERWLVEDWRWHERLEPAQLPPRDTTPRVVICDVNPDLHDAFSRFNDRAEYVRVDSLEQAASVLAEFSAQTLILNDASPRLLLDALADAHQRWPDLPVIGCSLPPRLGHALAAGASGQLLKPITRAELAAVIEETGPGTVLVVDDDGDTRRLFTRMLAAIDEELRVVQAANGAEALARMRDVSPDLVLLDVMLPDMDGWQVLAAKAQDPALRPIPTFLLSAQDPADQPLSSQILIAAAGERTPFYKLLRCAQVIPLILGQEG